MNQTDERIRDVIKRAAADGVRLVNLQFTDLLGTDKSVVIPIRALRDTLAHGMIFDASAVEGFMRIEERDRWLWPDPATYTCFQPAAGEPVVAGFICDIGDAIGNASDGCTRQVLGRLTDQYRQLDIELRLSLEVEFFVFQCDDQGRSTTVATDQAGYFDRVPLDRLRQDLLLQLQDAGFAVRMSHHEVAPGQQEVHFGAADPLAAADQVVTFRSLARDMARRHGLHATFMPKPLYGVNGSGLHLHQWLLQNGKNAFRAGDGPYGLSKLAGQFIAGQLAHARSACALTNPLVNSYKRLVPGYEAPVYVAWSSYNRSPLIRVSADRGREAAAELRSPDPACNPYLCFAAVLAAGLDGIKQGLEPPPPVERNLYEISTREMGDLGIDSLPGSLGEAVEALMQDEVLLTTLGDYLAGHLIEAKQIEWDLYRTQVHQWEVEQYLHTF